MDEGRVLIAVGEIGGVYAAIARHTVSHRARRVNRAQTNEKPNTRHH
jgi:hypothetical protein